MYPSMDLFTLLRIAARNLTRHRRRSVIGLMALFFALLVMVLMKGFTNSISRFARDTIVEVHAGALQIHRQGFAKSIVSTPLDLDLPADATFLARLRAVPHVRAVTARIPAGAVVSAHDRSAFAAVLAFDPIEEVKVCPKRFAELTAGKPLAPDSPTGSALTQLLLTRLGAKQGEKVVLLSSDRDGVMNAVEVEVTGTLKDAGLLAAEKKLAYIPLASAQELLRMPERALELAVSIDDLDRLDEVAGALRTLLGPGYEVLTWRDLAGFDKDASEMREQQNLTMGILLVLALLGIANMMLMSVRERTREIGTMMAIGVKRRDVLALFLSEAAILGLVGSLLGILVGWALVHHFGEVGLKIPNPVGDRVNEFHPFLTVSYLAKLLMIAIGGAVLAAFYPARRASRLRPIEALSQVAT